MTSQTTLLRFASPLPRDRRSDSRQRSLGFAVAGLLALFAAGCSETPAEPPPPTFTATDSAGVRVVVNSAPQWAENEGWQVTPDPVLTLGTVDYPVEQQFLRLGEVTRLSDGTVVVLEIDDAELRAFDPSGTLLWTAGGIGDGPGETRPYDDTRAVLTRLPGDTLQLQNGQARVRFSSGGGLLEHVKVDYTRFRRWGRIFLQYCPFSAYFLQDAIVFCDTAGLDASDADSPVREQAVMRTDWSLDGLDTLGTFFRAVRASVEMDYSVVLAGPEYTDLMRERFGGRRTHRVSSPLGPKGILRVGVRDRPRLLYARNDRYRIEVWDILTGALSMVVERRAPRRARTQEEATYTLQWGVMMLPGNDRSDLDPADDRWQALDSLSIAEDFLLDELGFLWVRRSPSPSEGDEGLTSEFTDYTGKEWTLPRPSGLHDVFRPDGVYLGTVQLPHDLEVEEIGADYVLGKTRDGLDVEYVRVYGLDRGGGPG
ncbi:MAG: hypothetical protein OXL34_12210 [Gemmatimonadota bacterium]|nr:hypothetical protein [Gemmatimonadota bacterium]